MARRKRLEISEMPIPVDLETKSAVARARMPIAEVAGDTAGQAALEEVAREMTAAEDEGRIVKKLPLQKISVHHLSRDRMVFDEEDMEVLKASIADRGQQTPIEVVRLSGGTFGLISGLRRYEALKALKEPHVLALVRAPKTSHAAYQAMVEENEVRANLSFYERANIAVAATGQGVYPDVRAAVKELFAHAPKAKRSKILKFVTLREALGKTLSFPAAIPEHLGFKLAQAIEADRRVAGKIGKALRANPPQDAAAERRILEGALKGPVAKPARETVAPGLMMDAKAGRVVLTGTKVDDDFLQELRGWIAGQAVR